VPLLADVALHGRTTELLIDRGYLGSDAIDGLRRDGVAFCKPTRSSDGYIIPFGRGNASIPGDRSAASRYGRRGAAMGTGSAFPSLVRGAAQDLDTVDRA
jgi:hypothetical protein